MIAPDELAFSPTWLPLDRAPEGTMRLIRLTEADYRAASFLDPRLLQTRPTQTQCPIETLAAAAAQLVPATHFIFHIGHVGSTLLSRLLGEHPALFALREPTPLRALAQHATAPQTPLSLPQWLALFSRTWRAGQRPLIKATSFVNEISTELLACVPDARALLLYTPAPVYLRAILAGPNSRLETRALAPSRLERLRRRMGETSVTAPRSEGQWVAMSWLCEMTALGATAAKSHERVLWMDFEHFLLEPAGALTAALAALGAAPDARFIETVLTGPLMHQYSKAPEHAYDGALRRQVLAQADREHAAEIRAGLEWLAGLAGRHPLIAAALAR